jgi:hypothetical protein
MSSLKLKKKNIYYLIEFDKYLRRDIQKRVTCCLSLSLFFFPYFSAVVFPVLLTSETSRSTLFTGLSLERASSKENATCTHTHTLTHLYCQKPDSKTNKPKTKKKNFPSADLSLPNTPAFKILKIFFNLNFDALLKNDLIFALSQFGPLYQNIIICFVFFFHPPKK